MTLKALMVDVDGVLVVHSHPRGWTGGDRLKDLIVAARGCQA